MKYAIIKIVNGNFTIDSEWGADLKGAIVRFHAVCGALWNDADVEKAKVEIVDINLDVFEDYKETIFHEPVNA